MAASEATSSSDPPVLLTIGHSTRSIDSFIELLAANEVQRIIDIRTLPGSRRNPQYNREQLESSLRAAGIEYAHWKLLGGLRRPRADSPNAGWRNPSFRGFADYMQTEEFAQSIEALMKEAAGARVALMCAEAVPWRCHRSLIADALVVRGWRVEHIVGPGKTLPHAMTGWAHVEGIRLSYPPEAPRD